MKVAIEGGLTYTPEWGDNRNLPEDEQIIIHYRYLTGPERDKHFGMGAIPMELDPEGKVPQKLTFKMDRDGIVRSCVIKIEGLEIGNKKATKSHLFTLPELAELYEELADFFLEENQSIDKKKLN